METKIKNSRGEFVVFVDPDPNSDNRAADWTYTVQVSNETKRAAGELFVGRMTGEMDREAAMSLYYRLLKTDDPDAYLRAVNAQSR